MFCPNCGSKLDDDAKFCTSCGQKIEDNEKEHIHKTKEDTINEKSLEDNKTEKIIIPNNKKNTNEDRQRVGSNYDSKQSVSVSKGSLKKVGIGALVLLLLIVGYNYWKNRPVTIALSDYYNVKFEGADGHGSVDYEFDDKKFINENKDKIKLNYADPGSVGQNPISLANDLAYSLDYNTEVFVDPEENLSNGDEVTLSFNNESIDIENYYKVKIKNDNKKVKVDGLKEVAEIDPSDYYEVEVEGISPKASLNIVKKEDAPEYFDLVTVDVDKKDYLSSGDEVNIKFNYDEDRLINEYGVVISPETIKVPIDGIASYISSYDELSDSDKKEIEEEAGYQVDEQARDWTDADLTNKNLIGTVTVSPKQEGGLMGI